MSESFGGTFLVKIIPPRGSAIVRLAFSRRHLIAVGAALCALLIAALGIHTAQLHAAESNVRALQAVTSRQQTQLTTIDRQADALARQLQSVQRQNAEIRRLIGGGHARGSHASSAAHGARTIAAANTADLAAVAERMRRLAQQSAATQADAQHLRGLAFRVLNVRRIASIARTRMIAMIPSVNPVGGAIAAGYGWRTNPWPEFHKGVDLEADYGQTVHAAAGGVVASAGWDAGGFGNKVDIDHGNGYHTWYAHLSRIAVHAGETVSKGEPIAFVGSTGESTGPHLHYQVMLDGQPTDPAPFLGGVPARILATLPDSESVR